jgi:hypothetical protein
MGPGAESDLSHFFCGSFAFFPPPILLHVRNTSTKLVQTLGLLRFLLLDRNSHFKGLEDRLSWALLKGMSISGWNSRPFASPRLQLTTHTSHLTPLSGNRPGWPLQRCMSTSISGLSSSKHYFVVHVDSTNCRVLFPTISTRQLLHYLRRPSLLGGMQYCRS